MKAAILLALTLPLSAPNAFAATTTQKVADKARLLLQNILHASGDPGVRERFIPEFAKILDKAHCVKRGEFSVDCSQASSDQLDEAQDALDGLTEDFKKDLAQAAATKALALKAADKAQSLRPAIENVKPDAARDMLRRSFAALLAKAKCRMAAASVDCSQATADQLATAQADLDALVRDISQANAQATATQALAKKTADRAQGLRPALGAVAPAAAQAQLNQRFTGILAKANCRPQGPSSVDCSQASADALAAAQTELEALARDIGQAAAQTASNQTPAQRTAVQTTSNQPLAQKTADRAQGLRPALGAVAPAAAHAQLNQRFSGILDKANCRPQGPASVDCSLAPAEALAAAQTELDALARDIGLAASQEAATQAFAQKLFVDIQTLRSAIGRVPSPDAQNQLNDRLSPIANINCPLKSGVGCSELPAGTLQAARTALDRLRPDVGAAAEASPLDAAQGATTASAKFLADAGGVVDQINARELPAAAVSGFLNRVAKVRSDAGCNGPAFTISLVKQTGFGGLPLPPAQVRRPADPCQSSTPAQLAAGEAALRVIERDYQSQVKPLVEGGLTELYAARVQDLYAQVDQAQMAAPYAAKARAMIQNFTSELSKDKSPQEAADDYAATRKQFDPYVKQWREN